LLAGPGPGFRAVDALFVRIKDLELKPARVFVIGEYTKIKTNRYVFLTEEIVSQSNQ
jgi:integrase